MVYQKYQRAATVPMIQLTSAWPMLHAQTMKRALVMMGFIRMALFAQRVSVNETFYDDVVELNVLGCRVDILGTNCDQCVSMVQCCFTSTETVRLISTGSPGRPP